MKQHHEKYKKIAEDYGIPVHVAQSIVDSQFAFCRDVISEGKDEPIRLQFLGKFEVKPGKREKVRIRREWAKKIRNEKSGRKE